MKGNFIAYYRVSTGKQGASGLGLEAEGKTVVDYSDGVKWTLAGELTEVESGKNSNVASYKRRQSCVAYTAPS